MIFKPCSQGRNPGFQRLDLAQVGQRPCQQKYLIVHQVPFKLCLNQGYQFVGVGQQLIGKWLVIGQQSAPESMKDSRCGVVVGIHAGIVNQSSVCLLQLD